ncbi:hypothetical protein AMJ71_02915 [candidate division TA06 bacterium SM1_40]|uniref:Nmd3 N-terminal domain-containing protein n=2 Tax=Bacteria division TA06 TaxID=1156500 RepID=A0A0S8JM30_UNCT6|nr:MAG: hypothetical protein AMJ82_02975 [candidate division TA06 bacterium SM23_40]KPL10482.1 MAG: hypothetical protein AMJ71_02915 [candidate division TA06 bacterium SM1_40]
MARKRRVYVRRGVDPHLEDPYLRRGGYREPTVCPTCGLVFHDKRWRRDDELSHKLHRRKQTLLQKCPACRKIEDQYPMGIVTLSGHYLPEHLEDIRNLIRNEEQRGAEKNPLERIIKIEEGERMLVVQTTTESLALRIGRIVFRAHRGSIDYKFSDREKLVRIDWHRD